MVKFGRPVFYLFGRQVKNSAIRFCIYSSIWIRPYVQVRNKINSTITVRLRGQLLVQTFTHNRARHLIYPNERGGSFRPNNIKLEGQILLTIRPNSKAEFDRKAQNMSSLNSAQYINSFICYKTT